MFFADYPQSIKEIKKWGNNERRKTDEYTFPKHAWYLDGKKCDYHERLNPLCSDQSKIPSGQKKDSQEPFTPIWLQRIDQGGKSKHTQKKDSLNYGECIWKTWRSSLLPGFKEIIE